MKEKNLKPAITAFLAGMLSLHLLVAWSSRELIKKGYPDFTTFYAAGLTVRQNLGAQMYDEQTQYRIEQQFAAGVSIRHGALPYIHPPFEALLFVPLTWLPYFLAYLVWNSISLLILGVLPYLLRPHVALLRRASPGYWLFASTAFFPIFITFLQGQDSILLLLVFAMAYLCLRKNADFSAGCWLGLGLFRFHLVLPLIFMLLWQKRTRTILGFSLVAIVLGLLSATVVGWQGVWAYPSHVWHLEQVMGVHGTVIPRQLPNLRGLLALLVPGLPKIASDVVVSIVSIFLVVFTAVKWRTAIPATFNLGFSLGIIVTLLIGYHTMPYDLVLLVLPLALVIDDCIANDTMSGRSRMALLAPIFLLFLTPLQMFLSFRSGRYSLIALVLLWWGWAVARELSRAARMSSKPPVTLELA